MDIEEFNQKMTTIHHRMEQISKLTLNMAFANCANPTNSVFADLMKNQNDLIKAADKLIEIMLNQTNQQ